MLIMLQTLFVHVTDYYSTYNISTEGHLVVRLNYYYMQPLNWPLMLKKRNATVK